MNFLLFIIGLASLVAGIYLWLGLPAALIIFGLVLIYTAVRLEMTGGDENENINTKDETI